MSKQRNIARLFLLTLTLPGLISGVTLMPGSAKPVSAQTVTPSWTFTGGLNTGRAWHTATLFSNKVLIARTLQRG
jgi:hypothetical protein